MLSRVVFGAWRKWGRGKVKVRRWEDANKQKVNAIKTELNHSVYIQVEIDDDEEEEEEIPKATCVKINDEPTFLLTQLKR